MEFMSSVPAADPGRAVQYARQLEDWGFDVIAIADHLTQPLNPLAPHAGERPYFDSFAVMGAVAVNTQRARLVHLVMNGIWRHPALAAQHAVTIDVLSGGRAELGIGAGWFESECRQFGIAYPPARERVDRLAEALQVARLLLSDGQPSFAGTHFTLDAAVFPNPVQAHLPILTGVGSPRALAAAGRYADIVQVTLPFTPTGPDISAGLDGGVAAYRRRCDTVREAAAAAGREVRLAAATWVFMHDDAETLDAILGMVGAAAGVDVATVRRSPMLLAGTPAEVADRVGRLEDDFGISRVGVASLVPDGVQHFAERVLPQLR